MYGAIFGDIIGSRFEFDRGGKTKDFELFTREDNFTDDTAMTIAVADGLLKAGKDASVDEIHKAVIRSMKDWGHRYPNAGYGGRFYGWLFSHRDSKPYGSYGNGSAMRVSAAGWLYDSLDRTREMARATAEVTHNHPEGIKGAECTAAVMFLARTGADKDEIKSYVAREFGYNISKTVAELRPLHEHVESCQDSLPKALASFFEGESYEDVVRNAVSLGGDTDTLAAIAGAMAEAFYGIPVMIMAEGKNYLPDDMLQVLEAFDTVLGRKVKDDSIDDYENNKYIKMAVSEVYRTHDQQAFWMVLDVLMKRMAEEGQAPTPMVDVNHVMDSLDPNSLTMGGHFSLDQDMRLTIDTMQDGEGKQWIPLFTDDEELHKGETTNISINMTIQAILESGYHSDRAEGVVINPFGQALTLPKEILKIALEHFEEISGKKDE